MYVFVLRPAYRISAVLHSPGLFVGASPLPPPAWLRQLHSFRHNETPTINMICVSRTNNPQKENTGVARSSCCLCVCSGFCRRPAYVVSCGAGRCQACGGRLCGGGGRWQGRTTPRPGAALPRTRVDGLRIRPALAVRAGQSRPG